MAPDIDVVIRVTEMFGFAFFGCISMIMFSQGEEVILDWIRICIAITIFATLTFAFIAIASHYHFKRKDKEKQDPFDTVDDKKEQSDGDI